MSENPLLPHAKLRELYAGMQRCRLLDDKAARQAARKGATTGFAREGLIAATVMQLEAGDVLVPEAGDLTPGLLQPLASEAFKGSGSLLPASLRLPLCTGIARGLQTSTEKRVALCFTRSGAVEPAWTDALTWAQEQQLPLILACADIRGPGRKPKGELLTSAALTDVAQRCGLPVFTVDAEDAVAVYRVMYESLLRAREGGGPAVIWGIFSKPSSATSTKPIARLRGYLKVRGITLQA